MSSVMPCTAITIDRFKCVTVSLSQLNPEDSILTGSNFEPWLKSAESEWHRQQLRGIWFKIPLTHSAVIPILAQNQYEHHHAKPDCLAMIKWISETESNNIPSYPFTNIGVGGLVVDSQNRVLVIQEKYAVRGMKLWKFPGGTSDQGEEISQTAEREVFEETGVRAKFHSILTIRHLHRYQFGCSDLYIVCLLTVDETDPNALNLTRCVQEIDALQWMALEEAMNCLSEYNRFVVEKYLLSKRTGFSIGSDDVNFILGGTLKVYSLKQQIE